MKIDVETLEEILGEVETEEKSEIILPFLKKIAELEEKNEALEKEIKQKDIYINNLQKRNEILDEEINVFMKDTNKPDETEIDFLKNENEDLQRENERKDNIIKSIEKNSTDLLMSNEELREKISKLEDTNRKLSGELLNQNEEIHMLEEEIDRLKSENEDLKRLNRQIQENVK